MNNATQWSEAILSYQTALLAAGRASGTVRLKRYYLHKASRLASTPRALTTEQLNNYIADHAWKPETRRSFISTVRSFYTWAVHNGVATHDPTDGMLSIKIEPILGRPASDRDIANARRAAPYRVKLMILLGAAEGMRCCEIARIHSPRDWDGRILVVHGKGNKDRALPIANPHLIRALNQCDGWLFPGNTDGHLSAGYVSKLISRHLPDGVTAHMLRHRFATVGVDETHDIVAVSAALGHAKLETTRRYVRLHDAAVLRVVEAVDVPDIA
jgi:site-specific recombinase XerD